MTVTLCFADLSLQIMDEVVIRKLNASTHVKYINDFCDIQWKNTCFAQ